MLSTLLDEQKRTKALNKQAYSDLILSMDDQKAGGRVAFDLLKSSTKSKDYEDGNARYAPKSAPTMTKLSEIYQCARLKEGKDPDVYITYLEDLRNRLEEMERKVTKQHAVHGKDSEQFDR